MRSTYSGIVPANGWVLSLLSLAMLLVGCDAPTRPRPRSFHRLTLPPHAYQPFAAQGCPFTFDIPTYARIAPDTLSHGARCFYNLDLPGLANARLHITLRDFRTEKTTLGMAFEDHRKLVLKHATRTSEIERQEIQGPNGGGIVYQLYGQVPEPISFFYTDSTRYALIGALYFATSERNDSLAPIIQHLRTDVAHLVESIRFEKPLRPRE
jgi:gliding motility-associated lipoprotein GldD